MEIDSELEYKLNKIKKRLEDYLFNEKDLLKWDENKKVKINNNFKPMLQGDWSRYQEVKSEINLSKLLGQKITKNELFQKLANELDRPYKKGDYNHNFNPNLFFLFFDKFYKYKIKKQDFLFFEKRAYHDGPIIGILIDNAIEIRPEIVKTIEMHSMFLLNDAIVNILSKEDFVNIFFENCFIQYKVETEVHRFKKNYVDIAYKIKDKEIFIEILEDHHKEINDLDREKNILLTSGSRLLNFKLYDLYETNETFFKSLIIDFCKICYRKDLSKEALNIYFVLIDNLDIKEVEFTIDIFDNINKITLSELLSNKFFEHDNLDIDEVIKKAYERGNIVCNIDFANTKKILSLKKILDKKDELILTPTGIINLLISLDGKEWSIRHKFIEFFTKMIGNYIEAIKNLLQDDSNELLRNENRDLLNYINLANYDCSLFFEKVNFNSKFHEEIPFIIKDKVSLSYVDYTILSNFIKEEYKSKIKHSYYLRSNKILGYRLLMKKELNDIYSNYGFID
jgi:hypothetical protein